LTSLLFAIWHIVPAGKIVTLNFQMSFGLIGMGIWFAGIFGAFLAGLFFAVLRHYSRNVIGCVMSHTLINDIAFVIICFFWK
jgi:membrane protease YdiL (CAAX protease family)